MAKGGQWQLITDTLVMGLIGALSAQMFTFLLVTSQKFFLTYLAGYRPPGLAQEGGMLQQVIGPHGLWLIPLSTTLGALISGILVYSLAPDAEGHGTDATVKAFHQTGGFIRARIPGLKMVASAITIGSGGAAGREGPTALITSGIGSVYAVLTHRSEQERRLLLLTGMAGGLSAIFRSPIGTAIFAVEVLYSSMEFESHVLLYAMLASVLAYVVNGFFVGWEPLFQVPGGLRIAGFADYMGYIVLGVASGLVATLLPVVFYGVRDAFRMLPLPPHINPAIGGLVVGLLALKFPHVLGGGYGWIQEAINGHLGTSLLALLLFCKMIAFAMTVASGGSGGVFAPSLYIGAMLGGFLAQLFHQPPAAYVVVGMVAVFGAAARVPIATLIMVTEMTGGYQLLVPAALAVIISYFIQTTLSARFKYNTLYEAQVSRRSESPAHHAEILQIAFNLLNKRQISIPAPMGHLDLLKLLTSGIPVDLPDGKQLIIETLSRESPCAGKTIPSSGLTADEETEIVGLLQDGHMRLPANDTRLQTGDQLLVITSPQARMRLEKLI